VLRVNAKDFPGEAIHTFVALAKPWGLSSASSQRPQAWRLQCAMVHNFYQLGVRAVRLMTNNPTKVEVLEIDAVRVTERVVIVVGQTASNR
jgi:GTP cyclohydrolase II